MINSLLALSTEAKIGIGVGSFIDHYFYCRLDLAVQQIIASEKFSGRGLGYR